MTAPFDEYRGDLDGRPVMWVKDLFSLFGVRFSLHAFTDADSHDCFHTHPAWAVRVVLSGGYIETFEDGSFRRCGPGHIGLVRPALCHRIASLINGRSSWSLWIRFPKCAEVQLRGDGWAAHE